MSAINVLDRSLLPLVDSTAKGGHNKLKLYVSRQEYIVTCKMTISQSRLVRQDACKLLDSNQEGIVESSVLGDILDSKIRLNDKPLIVKEVLKEVENILEKKDANYVLSVPSENCEIENIENTQLKHSIELLDKIKAFIIARSMILVNFSLK